MKIKTYTVKALSVGGRQDKIFNSGDVVTERDFNTGVTEKLVTDGFLTFKEEVEDPNPELVTPDENVQIEFISAPIAEVHRKEDGTEGANELSEEDKVAAAIKLAKSKK